jgi:transporter family-2 protein
LAVAVAVSDRLSASGSLPLIAVLLAFSAGLLIAVQQAINAEVGEVAGSRLSATWVNSALGTVVLSAALGVTVVLFGQQWSSLPAGPGWMYAGGVIGLVSISTAVWVVPILGVLSFALLLISGQLVGALLLDFVAPAGGYSVTWALVSGVLLAFLAVGISLMGRRR